MTKCLPCGWTAEQRNSDNFPIDSAMQVDEDSQESLSSYIWTHFSTRWVDRTPFRARNGDWRCQEWMVRRSQRKA